MHKYHNNQCITWIRQLRPIYIKNKDSAV